MLSLRTDLDDNTHTITIKTDNDDIFRDIKSYVMEHFNYNSIIEEKRRYENAKEKL